MWQNIKQGFGIAMGIAAGFAVLVALSNGVRVDISRPNKNKENKENN